MTFAAYLQSQEREDSRALNTTTRAPAALMPKGNNGDYSGGGEKERMHKR